eukprot:TRINITY_DN3338_c0_g3_i1.p1 TRINITY_DN3338_c0_g3~~TRINITY_DN3338_c0_g3_i1.p1  ORF type:complete len:466 (-),score=29.96 TRINITY_DN3338_c0_g3_i1:241-1464(-)
MHLSALKLMCINWNESQKPLSTVVSDRNHQDGFPGIYCVKWISQPFINNQTVIVGTQFQSDQAIISVDLESGQVVRLTPKNRSFDLLQVSQSSKNIYAGTSSPTEVHKLAIAKFTQESAIQRWTYYQLNSNTFFPEVARELKSLTYEVVGLDSDGHPIDLILICKQRSPQNKGLLGFHGGPHAAASTNWSELHAFLALQGYCVVHLNYRGSWGFGADALESLPGSVGTNDVNDAMLAYQWSVDNGYMNRDKCWVMGGSHGGFMVAHLLGQYPEKFQGGIMRNPVCDLSVMAQTSDLPKWCFIEAYGKNTELRYPMTVEDYDRFCDVSPMRYFKDVQKPMLFLLGGTDQRVPYYGAQRFIQALRGSGKLKNSEVREIRFEKDGHLLSSVRTQLQITQEIIKWLSIHRP